MSAYSANPYYDNSRAASQGRRAENVHTEDGGNRRSRNACDFFIFISLLASIAFIISGLSTNMWVYFGQSNSTSFANRGLFGLCGVNTSGAFVSGCMQLDLGSSTSGDTLYWNIMAMRRTQIAFFIISVVMAGIATLVHAFCCVPTCRRRTSYGFWKNSIASGVFAAIGAVCQIIGMIIFQSGLYYEVLYNGLNCVDCYALWAANMKAVMRTSYGVAYALGWAAAGLLVYASYAYLSREICVVRKCRPPPPEPEEFQNLETVSGISAASPYMKGTAREQQMNQVYGAPRLQRYDMAMGSPRTQPQPATYASPYSVRSELAY